MVLRGWLEFNVPFQQKYSYVRDEHGTEETEPNPTKLTQWKHTTNRRYYNTAKSGCLAWRPAWKCWGLFLKHWGQKNVFTVDTPQTACGRDRTGAVPRPLSTHISSTAASQQATRERSPNLDQTFADLLKPYTQQTDTGLMASFEDNLGKLAPET